VFEKVKDMTGGCGHMCWCQPFILSLYSFIS